NKEHLLKHAFAADSLEITETDETIEFPWFLVSEPEDSDAYCKFISALCEFAKTQKRINNKLDTSDNEKYAFRCFLLRLGMIGSEYKAARKVLLRNLTGSSAFRHGKPKGETDHEVSE
ncbi:MAG: virulence protein, partial [Oscillospiraceae bacterium]|nr:virulence protein [Oscillospiraceae bacterium]